MTAAPQRPTAVALKTPRWAFSAAGVATLLILLEAAPRLGLANPRFLPPVSEILGYLASQLATGTFWAALGHTLMTWAVGLGIALIAGVTLGVLFGTVPAIWRFTSSTVEFLRPVPSVALIPVAVLIFGTQVQSTLMLVIYASVWPILIQVIAGVGDVDPVMKDTAASFRLAPRTRIMRMVWPTALPYAITGFRLSAATALIITVTGELLISLDGIGGLFETARQSGLTAGMYAYVVVAGIIGVLVNLAARSLERATLFWHPSIRRSTP
jgi:ABC-type nitrate/sulfonate/bicarbonate transport system permease component